MPRTARVIVGISIFNAGSAIGGGIALVTGTLPVPISLLRHTPFDSYVIPGLFLAVVMGGSSLVGALALPMHARRGRLVSAATGLMMVGWIMGETMILRGFSWLQGLYLVTGLLIAVGSWRLPKESPEDSGVLNTPLDQLGRGRGQPPLVHRQADGGTTGSTRRRLP